MYVLSLYGTRHTAKMINLMMELYLRLLTCMVSVMCLPFSDHKTYYVFSEGEARNLNHLYWWNWEENVDRN